MWDLLKLHPDLSSVALDKPAWRRAPAGALLPLLLLLQLADKAIDCEKRDTQGWSAYQYVPHMMPRNPAAEIWVMGMLADETAAILGWSSAKAGGQNSSVLTWVETSCFSTKPSRLRSELAY